MKVTKEKTENGQAFLTIEMESAEVAGSLEEAYQRLVKKTSVPGFRKGKTPREVLERYLGKESILEEALQHLVPQACAQAIKEQEIEPIAQPQIEVTQVDPVIFKAVVPLSPTVVLGDYHSIKVEPEAVEVTEEQTGAVMEELRHQHATWEPVERPVNFGDLVVLDIEGSAEGEYFINRQGAQYQVIGESPSPAPGFAEQIVGMNRAEEKEFKLTFPEDYVGKELAGKEASFKVKIIEVKQEKLPELDDELAKLVNPAFKTLDSLQEQVSTSLRHRAEDRARADFEERVIAAVVDQAQVDFPPILVEVEIDRLRSEYARNLQMSGRGLEEYLKSINKTEEQMREELRPLAIRRVTSSLVLGKVVEAEKIGVGDAEIDTEIERVMETSAEKGTQKEEELRKFMNTPQTRESIKQALTMRKAIERLTEIAKGSGKAKSKGKERKK